MKAKIMLGLICLLILPITFGLEFSQSFPAGMNLVSIPVQLDNNTIPKAFETFMVNISSLSVYRNPSWLFYSPSAPSFLNTLHEVYVQEGIWINMKKASGVTVYGTGLSYPKAYNMKFGWNLISYPSTSTSNVSTVFGSVMPNIYSIFSFENTGMSWNWYSYSPARPAFLNTLFIIKPWLGLWVNIKNDATWNFGGTSFSNVSCTPSLEVCDGIDNDCNPGTPDGSSDPLVGITCDGIDTDLCKEGTNSCSAGALVCSDNTGSTLDICDGLDNDCDPASTDGSEDPQNGQTCDGPDSDLCLEGTKFCLAGALSCSDSTGSNLDICNGLDDDCDASSVDGSEDPLNGQSCDGPDSDLCKEGTNSCSSGALLCSDNTGSTIDICDGLDNDCDPASTDGSEDPQNGLACDGADSDLCLEGTKSCSAGALVCSDNTASTVDLCNGLDDDCDASSADGSEDPQNGQACDGPDSDLCLEGTKSCSAGSLVCSDVTGSTVDLCNGLNDDCDASSADGSEDPLVGIACDGSDSDLCKEGTSSCSSGAVVCSDNTGNNNEVCNGLDDDCDNLTDSADASLQLTLCELQLGVCAGKSHTASQCVSGAWNPCDATNYGVYYGSESCDTRDNDCDGTVDENGATNCTSYYYDWDRDGYGLTSNLQCVCPLNKGYYNATLNGDCNDTNPFMFPGFTEVCDSFDNDCDSIADECGNSTPDPFEPNNDFDHAYFMGNAIEYGYGTEWSCWTVSFDMYNDNEDWWYYSINDTQVQIVDPRAKISLSNLTRNNITVQQDMNVDVCLYFDRGKDGSIDYSNCSNKPGSSWENVSISVETGGDDSGYLYYQLKKISGNSCSKLSVCDHW